MPGNVLVNLYDSVVFVCFFGSRRGHSYAFLIGIQQSFDAHRGVEWESYFDTYGVLRRRAPCLA